MNLPLRPNQVTPGLSGPSGPRWDKVLMEGDHFSGPIALGNMTQFNVVAVMSTRGLSVGIEGYGCYTFCGETSYEYAASKLGLRYDGDAMAISDWINAQLIEWPIDRYYLEQGQYEESLCKKELP